MRIGLITYNYPHKKTYDVACLLKTRGYDDVTLLWVEWENRKTRHPLIQHRPDGIKADHISLARNLGFHLDKYGKVECDKYLVGGCGIIPGLRAINSHPGFLPLIRGLDALKWAIYYDYPVGVTTHHTTDEVDKGKILNRKLVPLYFEDTFHSFAYRAYTIEIQLLVNSIDSIEFVPDVEELPSKLNMRMPPYKEAIMLERFEKRRKKSPSMYEE